MKRGPIHSIISLLDMLPGWMFLLSGLVIVASFVLIGPWLELRQLQWQEQKLKQEVDAANDRLEAWHELSLALQQRDPQTTERLAGVLMNRKSANVENIELPDPVMQQAQFTQAHSGQPEPKIDPPNLTATELRPTGPNPLANWVDGRSAPDHDIAPPAPIHARLVHLVTGPTKYGVLALGAVLLLLAIVMSTGEEEAVVEEQPTVD